MFNRFKSRFTRQTAAQHKTPQQQQDSSRDTGGYFRPQSADELLSTPLCRQCLQQLWENGVLPEGLYQRFYLTPLRQLLSNVQRVPATREGIWSGSGGFIDLTLKFTTYAVRLAKGHMLPPGAAPETQAAQRVLWQAVVFWAALFYHLPLLRELEGELEDGHPWPPGLWTPARRFRFRFRSSQSALPVTQEALLAARLIPEEAVIWLTVVPEAWSCLALHLGGHSSSVPLIDTLFQDAASQVQSPLLKPAELSEPTAAVKSSPELNQVFTRATPGTASVPDTADDTQTLLSLFQTPE
ncbi:conserved hypothetical protein [Xenorhabdus bovienii str. puntauvense]|uniref:Uncharacterized domain-containing protein n=1 Tax=Xenorhabdus bovienii str. puntauvense TaxID=1398201 RepID=A0A077NEU2_XENBV|nr:TraI domain-containing protein [Xenorhabdus bovienii]CDG97364.1 conserved hypothetical protein [Xenorhabdus bovienii str. puntauvense]